MTRFVELVLAPRQHGVQRRVPAVSAAHRALRPLQLAGAGRAEDRRARVSRTSIRGPSCGTSAWSTRTIGARSTTSAGAHCSWRSSTRHCRRGRRRSGGGDASWRRPCDDRCKLFATSALLRFRRAIWRSSSAAATIRSTSRERGASTCSRSRAATDGTGCSGRRASADCHAAARRGRSAARRARLGRHADRAPA